MKGDEICMATIRAHQPSDETAWLRCRVLSFLDTAYFDDVVREKPHYVQPAIELIAEFNGVIVGLMDIECESEPETVCSPAPGMDSRTRGGMIWNLAVHPDFRRQGIARALLHEARKQALEQHLTYLQAWTRDDHEAQLWYLSQGFQLITSYLHVFLDGGKEIQTAMQCSIPGMLPVTAFAHYLGEDREEIKRRFKRVHECRLYQLQL